MINKAIDKVNVDKTNNFIDNVVDEKNEITNTIMIKNKKSEVINTIVVNFFDFLLCFVRICLCNLMLLSNLIKQRLYVNFSFLRFVIN